jgi:hypothetical protein
MKKIIILSLILVFFFGCFVFAETTIPNPVPWDTFEELIGKLIEWIINMALVIAPLIIVFAGLSYATAGGDPGKIEKAKTILLYAVVGMAVVLLAKSLIETLGKIIVPPSNP